MSKTITSLRLHGRRILAIVVIASLMAAVAWATRAHWLPESSSHDASQEDHSADAKQPQDHAEDDHVDEQDEHAHGDHADDHSIELSAQALKNIGLEPVTIELSEFERTVTIPAIVVEQPGRSQIHITAPLTGIVTDIDAVRGQAVEPGHPMFRVRLTHEDLVSAQRDYLQTAENLDIVNREIARLEALEGAVAGKRVLEQRYEKQKLEAALRAAEQALLLHGLNEAQVKDILTTRKLLSSLTVHAPDHSHTGNGAHVDHLFHVQSLPVSLGQQVEAGQELCVLADHCELFVEGRAFEDDVARLREAAKQGWQVTARLLAADTDREEVRGLKLLYLSDQIDPDSRAFRFYLRLPNEVALDQHTPHGPRFVEWRFKPGQRMELRVPVARWVERIVLPVEAVVEEGAEVYVYRRHGDHFDRVPVHVEYRDRTSAVIAYDGALFPGEIVAGRGAYQIHLALKNQAGGGVDPHAGHDH